MKRIKVHNQFSGGAGIEQVTFADGSTMDRAQIASAAWYRGSANSEGITGSNEMTPSTARAATTP